MAHGRSRILRKLCRTRGGFCRRPAATADFIHTVATTGLRGKSVATDPAVATESAVRGRAMDARPRSTQTPGVLGVHELASKSVSRRAVVAWLAAFVLVAATHGEEPISFVLPAANFESVPADAYPDTLEPSTPPTPLPEPTQPEIVSPDGLDVEQPSPPPAYESFECTNCNGSCNASGLPPRLPNGQYPDDWMWGCGGWPYANGPGTCDDWKVGPIWDVTVDGMVLTREHTDLDALEARMNELDPTPPAPEVTEQFDRGPGGRVYLTGLLPKNAGYQMFAGYEGVEEWNAAIVFPKVALDPAPPGDTTERRSLFYRSSFHSGELNFMRMCDPAWRPYCGVRYMKFDDEIWDESDQSSLPPVPGPVAISVTEQDMANIFDVENNLIGFQGGVKYDLWKFGRRFSLQGFVNSGVYYNKAKRSNLMQTVETQFTNDVIPNDPMDPVDESSVTTVTTSNLSIVERSDIAYVAEASLTGVFRLNKCWATRFGYQVLWIDGLQLADDAYLGTGVDSRSLIFHGWHAGVECRR